MQFRQWLLGAAAAVSVGLMSAGAQPVNINYDYQDFDFWGVALGGTGPASLSAAVSLGGLQPATFDIINDADGTGPSIAATPFNPAADVVTAWEAWFTLTSTLSGAPSGSAHVFLQGNDSGELPVGGSSVDVTVYGVDNTVLGSLTVTLQNTGVLGYDVIATQGDFTLDSALLSVWVNGHQPSADVPVPDGGASAGLLGLAAIAFIPFRKWLA